MDPTRTLQQDAIIDRDCHIVPLGGGGTHIGRWYGDACAALRTPFSGHILAPETHIFKHLSSSRDHTSIFEEKK